MDDANGWLEASLVCSGELAEAVAEVFSRFAPDGVVLNSITVFDNVDYEEQPTGDMQVVAYLPQDEKLEETRHHLDEAIFYMGLITPIPPVSYRFIADQDWMAAWKMNYKPIRLGQKLLILPAWVDEPDSANTTTIRISPDMAFGTGTHPSTQLCLIALERYGCQEMDVLDIGSGSGILSIAAAHMGAARVLGVDTDENSVPSARKNARLNKVNDRVQLEVGSLQDVLDGRYGLQKAPRVLANILAPVLAGMLKEGLAEIVSPSGLLILGGILETQAEMVLASARDCGLTLVETLQDGDWVVLVLRR